MKIVAISDLHGHLPQLPEADIICIVGDITSDDHRKDATAQWAWYNETYLPWVESLPARKVITVAGNHDYCFLEHKPIATDKLDFLLAHSSPFGVNDCGMLGDKSEDLGNKEMTEALKDKDIRYIFCRHIHTGNHIMGEWRVKKIVNLSYCKENKIPANEPYIFGLKANLRSKLRQNTVTYCKCV